MPRAKAAGPYEYETLFPESETPVQARRRDITLRDSDGKIIFERKNVETPAAWSDRACTIFAQKFFYGKQGVDGEERSITAVIHRVVDYICDHAVTLGYIDDAHIDNFRRDLFYLLITQRMAFNSPVWFNVGVRPSPQVSACFILPLEDTLEDILETCATEGLIYRDGSGSGINYSKLRGMGESLSSGGKSSGVPGFMALHDAVGNCIKSGGRTRRSAKMCMLNINHPDIEEFIKLKTREERVAHALIKSGWDSYMDGAGSAYNNARYQNANHSVMVSDKFMSLLSAGNDDWDLPWVQQTGVKKTVSARKLWRDIAENAWATGDPGVAFPDKINEYHTVPEDGAIVASNPCSEYLSLPNTACNLLSFNLVKFTDRDKLIDFDQFGAAIEVAVIAMDILITCAGYPTDAIRDGTLNVRNIGIGFSNLGTLLMMHRLPYGGKHACSLVGAISAYMTGTAYAVSGNLAQRLAPFPAWERNRGPMLHVLKKHDATVRSWSTRERHGSGVQDLWARARHVWDSLIEKHADEFANNGFRNSQVTVIAPTGTIALIMDCATTGIEPELAHIKYKQLSGGGIIPMIGDALRVALEYNGFNDTEIEEIQQHLLEKNTLDGCDLKDIDQDVFRTSFGMPNTGDGRIHYRDHIDIMAATQPFISGAISKTVNIPHDTAMTEIENIYSEAWGKGLKTISVYRDGCKGTQAMVTSVSKELKEEAKRHYAPQRLRAPETANAITHKFHCGPLKGYITAQLYADGSLGGVFIETTKQGSTIHGLLDTIAVLVSYSIQYGVPLKNIVRRLAGSKFEPSGFTRYPQIPIALSVIDYVMRWLGYTFLSEEDQKEIGLNGNGDEENAMRDNSGNVATKRSPFDMDVNINGDVTVCDKCGGIAYSSGTCYVCPNCGEATGCSG